MVVVSAAAIPHGKWYIIGDRHFLIIVVTLCWRPVRRPSRPSQERERETPLCFVLMAKKRSIEIDDVDVVGDSF